MAAQKIAVTPFWGIALIASVFFSLSTAFKFPSMRSNPEEVSATSRRQQSSAVSAQPAIPPFMRPIPSSMLHFMPPFQSLPVPSPQQSPAGSAQSEMTPSMPPMPSLPNSMPPYPSQMPYTTPSSPSMPSPVSSPPSTPISLPPSPPTAPTRGIKGGYWLSSSAEKCPPSTIPARYFTHLFYAFLPLDNSTYKLSITQPDNQWMENFTATLHAQNPSLKTFLSIGGGLSLPDTFSKMASSTVYRATFINSTIQIARKYGFDGLDLDWEFPNTPEDMSNLALLFKEWRESVEEESKSYGKPRLLISAAVYFSPEFFLPGTVNRSYPSVAIRDYIDFVNTLNFDYHGNWDTSVTAEHAVVYDNSSRISTSYGIDAWAFAGVPTEKIVMGLPLFGKTWELKDPNNHGIGAPAVGVGPGDNGIMFYKDIVIFNLFNGSTVVYDNASVSTYSYKGTDWIGYDGPISISKKVEFAKSEDLGGYFLWALSYDISWMLTEQGMFHFISLNNITTPYQAQQAFYLY